MSKINLDGLKGLKGSALSTLKGMYTPEGYASYIEANQSTIKENKLSNPWFSDIEIADNMYVTKLIKDDIGEDEYNRQGLSSKTTAEKIEYYNNRYNQNNNPLDALITAIEAPKQSIGDVNDKDLMNKLSAPDYDIAMFPDDRVVFDLSPKSDNSRYTISDILKRKSEVAEDVKPYAFSRRGSLDMDPNSKRAEYERSSYANEYLKAMDSSYKLTSDLYDKFYQEITAANGRDGKFLKHADFYNMPLTVENTKQMMADYYATKDLFGQEAALQVAFGELRNMASEKQGWFFGSNSRLGNVPEGFASAVSSSFINVGGFLQNAAHAVMLASGVKPEDLLKSESVRPEAQVFKDSEDPYAISDCASQLLDADTYDEFKKLPFFKRIEFLLSNAKVAKYANNVAKTGEYNPEKQQYLVEEGLSHIENIRKASKETDFWDFNTVFDLLPQAGYTVAAMYIGGGIAKGLGSISKVAGLRRAAQALTEANKLKLAKGILAIDDITILGLSALPTAATEASMDAQDVYDEVMAGAYNEMVATLNKKFEAEASDRNSDLWKYIEEEMSKRPVAFPTEGQHMTDEDYNRLYNEQIYSLMDKYYKENYQSLLDSPEFNKEVMGAAMRASANTMNAETMYIALGDLLFTNVLGRGVKATKRALTSRIRPSVAGRFALTSAEDGTTRAAVRNASKAFAKAKGVAHGAVETFEEGFEEQFQGVTSDVNTELAYDYLERYLNARYDGEATDELAKSFWQNLDVAQRLIGESMFSQENVFAFLMGAAGAGLGSPTVIRGTAQLAHMSKAERKSLSKGEIAQMLWRNPFVENINDNLTELKNLQTEAEYYNSLLKNQTIDIKALGDVNGAISWINQEARALANNDEVGARDARASQTMQTLLLMDRLKGTAYATAFKKQLEAMSRMDVNNLNEGSKSILDKARTIREDNTSTDAEILQDIKDRAKKTLNMMEQVDYWKAEIDSQFGSSIDLEVKNGIVTNHVMMSEWERRLTDINKSIADQVNKGKKVPVSTEGASDIQNAYAKNGSVEQVKEQISNIDKMIELLEKQTPKKERGAIYKSRINQLKAVKKELQSESKLLEEGGTTLIKAEEILSLSPEAKAMILDAKNFSNYSKEQQEEITKFKKDPNVTSELLQDIQDADTIQKKIKHSKEELYMLEKDKGFLSKYALEVKSEVAKRNLKTKLKTALEAKTYEEFEKAVDEYLAKDSITDYEQQVLDSVLRESKFYKKYSEHNEDLINAVNILNDSPEYLALDDNKKMLVKLMAKRALLTGQFTPNGILSLLTNSDFIEYAKKEGIDTTFLSTDEKDAFASAISNVFKQMQTYNKNVKLLLEGRKKKLENSPIRSAVAYITDVSEEERTTLDRKRYKPAKEKFDALFTRVAEYYADRKHTVLTKQEFIEFVSLFIDEDIDYTKIIDIDTSFNREDLTELLSEVNDWLKNREYTADLQNNQEYQEMDKLKRAIDQILTRTDSNAGISRLISDSIKELNSSFRGAFGIKEKVRKLPKIEGVRVFGVKRFDRLATETEKKWYLDNNIKENNEKAAEIFKGTDALDATVVLINDTTLAGNLQSEIGELNDDNIPLIMAVRVPVGTEGSTVIDGQTYLYIGLLQNSRTAGANRNTINDIRSVIIANGNPNGIVKTRYGKIYESKGIRIKRDVVNEGEIGIRDFYIGENGRFAKEWEEADTEEKKQIVKDKIEADFKNHFVKIHLAQDEKHKTDTGEYVTEAVYTAPGETKPRRYTYTTKSKYDTYVTIGWVDEKSPEKVYQFSIPTSGQIAIDEDGTSLFEALTNMDMQDTNYAYTEANIVRKAIKTIVSELTRPENIAALMNSDTAEDVSAKITKLFNYHINLLTKHSEKKEGVGDLKLKVETNGKDVFMHLATYDGTPLKMYSQEKEVGGQAILKVPLNYLTDKSKSKGLWQAAQLAVRDILFNEDGETRVDNNNVPLAKLQVAYNDIMSKAPEHKNYAKYLIFTNLLRMRQTHTGELSIETNETRQDVPSRGNSKEDAARALDGYTKTNPENKRLSDAIGVTTFIQDDGDIMTGDAITGDSGANLNRVSSVATSLGTSVDRLIRTVLYNQGKSIEEIVTELKKVGGTKEDDYLHTWPGFGKTEAANSELKAFISQISDVANMLAAKGETILPADYMFSTEVSVGNKYARLTAEPDLITVDKNGQYHIYDFKSFYGQGEAIAVVEGKVNKEFRIVGLSHMSKHIEKWQKQLSLYKLAIETKVGAGKVVELGVIPIRLGYNKQNAFVSEDKYPGLGVNRVFEEKGDGKTTRDRALKFNFTKNPLDQQPRTRAFKDIIKIEAVDPLTISSDRWMARTTGQVRAAGQNQAIQDTVSGKRKGVDSTVTTESQNQAETRKSLTIENIDIAPEVEETAEEKAARARQAITGIPIDANETARDEMINQENCQGDLGDLPDLD